ncbi:AraC family transcriptional regulator [Maribacter algarum]|uniref:AraC family transcriptional regulator n=1 Tax=Maribacter algarum (ex Zhang et al. 2020) TaxID=2578118 RepID=A0A5S3QK40_9FLAO|nr:helix-turn-helix domain-containing protein [Maribacter algarum]TMM58184.1 AraC family transcriptional regulator [Maribacter algarum]
MTAVFNFLMIAGSVQGFIFNAATFLSRKKIESPVLFLNLFVFFLSLNNLQSWLIDKGFIAFYYYTIPFYVLLAPMFHAFLVNYLGIEKKRKPFFKLTALVFVLELVARAIIISRITSGALDPQYIELYNAIEDALTLGFSIFIFYHVLKVLFRYQKLYASILAYDDLKWIKRLIQLGGIVLVLWGIAVLLNFVSETIKAPYSYYPLRLGTSIFIYWIGYQGFFRFVVLQDRKSLRKKIREVNKTAGTVSTDRGIDFKKGERESLVFNEMNNYVVNNQKYLDPYLSLEKLSEELEISTSKLSMLINQLSGKNFSDYINSLRVTDAKKLLANPDFEGYTIVSIGLECGFNSKSTFYTAFKKFTGQTPTTYRKSTSK